MLSTVYANRRWFPTPRLEKWFPRRRGGRPPAASVFIECGRSSGNSLLESVTAPPAAAPQQRPGQPGRAPAGPTGGGASAGSALGLPRGRGGRRPPQVQCKMDMVYTQRLCGRCPWLLSSVRSPGVCMHGTPPAVGSSTTGISAGSARTQDARSLVGQSCVSSFLQGELRGLVGAKL